MSPSRCVSNSQVICNRRAASIGVVIPVCSAALLTLPTYSMLPGLTIRDCSDWLGATRLVSKVMLSSENEDSSLTCRVCFALIVTLPLNAQPGVLRTKPPAPEALTQKLKASIDHKDRELNLLREVVLLLILTTVWTMWGLCMRKLFTVWNTSNSPSALTRSKILLSAMNVPVRPAPALQTQKQRNVSKMLQSEHSVGVMSVHLPAVYNNGVIPRLLLLSLNWGDDVDHTFPLSGNSHLRPAVEVEVSDHPRLLLLWGKKGQED